MKSTTILLIGVVAMAAFAAAATPAQAGGFVYWGTSYTPAMVPPPVVAAPVVVPVPAYTPVYTPVYTPAAVYTYPTARVYTTGTYYCPPAPYYYPAYYPTYYPTYYPAYSPWRSFGFGFGFGGGHHHGHH